MIRFLLAGIVVVAIGGTAQAADIVPSQLPTEAPVVAAPLLYSWSGCYVGAHIGGGWSNKEWFQEDGDLRFKHNADGFLGGGQVGCDHQTGSWVFGVEGQASWANLEGHSGQLSPSDEPNIGESKVDFIATATGRIGYVFDRTLIYVKGGAAWVHEEFSDVDIATGDFASGKASRTGWTVGTGLDYAVAPNWSVEVEYNYMDFGRDWVDLFGDFEARRYIDQSIHIVKVGVNYRFGGAVVAR